MSLQSSSININAELGAGNALNNTKGNVTWATLYNALSLIQAVQNDVTTVYNNAPSAISSGKATLSSGTVTVSSKQVTANSIILVTYNTISATLGSTNSVTALAVPDATKTAGVGFTINSYITALGGGTSVWTTDNSTVNYIIIG